MKLKQLLNAKVIKIGVEKRTKEEIIEELVTLLIESGKSIEKQKVLQAALDRESQGSTGLTKGVAVPHCKTEGVGELVAIAPERAVQDEAREHFARLVADYPVERFTLRMLKSGRTFYLLAHVVVRPDYRPESVQDLDVMRAKIATGMKALHPPWEVDTVFVADESLA